MKTRGFEVVSSYDESSITLPVRKTGSSAGYDFIYPGLTPVTIPARSASPIIKTGVKAYMPNSEFLYLMGRSSLGFKYSIRLVNIAGIIDSDYYNNADNEGEIMVKFMNDSDTPYTINPGDAICQGIFMKFGVTDDDNANGERTGGLGSTGA